MNNTCMLQKQSNVDNYEQMTKWITLKYFNLMEYYKVASKADTREEILAQVIL
jgi:hypothetical protein